MIKVAIYARYSTELQSKTSNEDQIRVCRERVMRDGGTVVETYSDDAISGTRAANRPALQRLLADAKAGRFTHVYSEALDRLSRDQEDVAGLFKRLRHVDVMIVTLSEGEISELHVGLKGTMNALFVRDLAAKIKRGQRGAAEAGRIPGGKSYGYDLDTETRDAKGERVKGLRKINQAEAKIVRRIFAEYIAGRGPKAIARDLNAEGIPSPRGGEWSAGTINGHPSRLFGILTNPTYNGEIVFNRVGYRKNPETGRREIHTTAQNDWVRVPAPELRIVDQQTWKKAQTIRAQFSAHGPHKARRPRHLLSGLVRCAVCGGPYAVSSKDRLACISYRTKGSCKNGRTVRVAELTSRVLKGVKERLLSPDLFREFAREWVKAQIPARKEREQRIRALDREKARVQKELGNYVKAIAKGRRVSSLLVEAEKRETRLAEIETAYRDLKAAIPVVEVRPDLTNVYRDRVANLETLLTANPMRQAQAKELLRELIGAVRIIPGATRGAVEIEVEGQLAQILALNETPVSPGKSVGSAKDYKSGAAGGN
jgi:site-specific DNA recombinase